MSADTVDELAEEYLGVLHDYLTGRDEAALEEAYALGRKALSQGVVPLVAAHHQALRAVAEHAASRQEFAGVVDAAAVLMMESMAVVEMALRGYQESNARLREEIVEHQKTQRELQAAREAAEAATHAKSQFLANMSHEIRTPMNAIIGMTELVLGTSLSRQQREYLTLVQESGDSLLALVNDILDLSRIEAGRLVLDPAPFDLPESLGDTMQALAIRAHRKGLELACRIAPEVPAMLVGDATRLRQVVVNLVGNAIKFTPCGEVVLEVDCAPPADDGLLLHFLVSDTGIGIPAEKHGTIFQAFEQADPSTTRQYGGSGLGLAISQRLVDAMGGRMWLESEVGRGSRFHFTARFAPAPDDAPRLPAEQAARIQGLRVLVVDDSDTNRRILVETLHNWNMLPTAAATAAEAVAVLRQAFSSGAPYGLIVTDAHMPGTDGFALAEQIKLDAELGSTVIIMLTSADQPSDLDRCRQLGLAAYLLKPIKQSELFDAVLLALGVTAATALDLQALAADRPRVGPLHILLAEDSLVGQKLVVAMLEAHGHRLTVVNNGKEAVAAASTQPFDLVLMDVQMPELDGFQATAAIRAQQRQTQSHTPIIAMTAHALRGDRERCLEAGMDAYLSKPVHAHELFDAIETLFPPAAAPSAAPGVAPTASAAGESVDWNAALREVEGDRLVLRTVAEAAAEELPRLTAAVGQAVVAGDATRLRLAAHTLKGSLRYFGPTQAHSLACALEQMGQEHNLAAADAPLRALEGAVARVTSALADYLRENQTGECRELSPGG